MIDSDLELDRQPVDLALLTLMLYLKTRNLELAQLPSKKIIEKRIDNAFLPLLSDELICQRDRSMKMFTSKIKAK